MSHFAPVVSRTPSEVITHKVLASCTVCHWPALVDGVYGREWRGCLCKQKPGYARNSSDKFIRFQPWVPVNKPHIFV